MATNSSIASLDPTVNPASIYFLHPSETCQKIVQDVFQGSGYGEGKRSMVIASSAKNKLGFVDGSVPKPDSTLPEAKAWERVNSVVIGCS